ncbi:hypothetical protein AN958_12254 [Leucoagaricus sp. SymC.cos]|nr:hypothetical protein AN958_12254 [Leucoagaricus sp. SymC.cos]
MGWTNSGPIFHEDVTYILHKEIPEYILPYIDDVPIAPSTITNDDSNSDSENTIGTASPSNDQEIQLYIPGVRELILEDYKNVILQEVRNQDESRSGDHQFLSKWNVAITYFIDTLSPEELLKYQAKAAQLQAQSKVSLTKEKVLRWQAHLPIKASNTLWKLLGWKQKQYGDGLFFLSVAVHKPSNHILVKKLLVSNNDGNSTTIADDFLDAYEHSVEDKFKTLADMWLPHKQLCHDKDTAPLLATALGGNHYIQQFVLESVMIKNVSLTKKDCGTQQDYLVERLKLSGFADLNPLSMAEEQVVALATVLSIDHQLIKFKGSLPASASAIMCHLQLATETTQTPIKEASHGLADMQVDLPVSKQHSLTNVSFKTPTKSVAHDLMDIDLEINPSASLDDQSSAMSLLASMMSL